MTGSPFRKSAAAKPVVRNPGHCRTCKMWTSPFARDRGADAGRCRSETSPYGGLPRLGWMGCIVHSPRATGKAGE